MVFSDILHYIGLIGSIDQEKKCAWKMFSVMCIIQCTCIQYVHGLAFSTLLFTEPKLMNNALDTFEPPEEYRITPVQPRHSYHSPPTTDVPITFHYPDSSPTHKPAPNVPQSNTSALSPSNATRHVHFKSSVLDPPPVPPRSVCFQSLSSYASTKVSETSSIVPPLSAPATSHTPTFFPDSAKNQICSRNPMFGRSSSSSVDDINLLVESNIGLFSPFKSESGLFNEQ